MTDENKLMVYLQDKYPTDSIMFVYMPSFQKYCIVNSTRGEKFLILKSRFFAITKEQNIVEHSYNEFIEKYELISSIQKLY